MFVPVRFLACYKWFLHCVALYAPSRYGQRYTEQDDAEGTESIVGVPSARVANLLNATVASGNP
eukprot:8117829-Pyramimonas_sp.AAC.1